jgi:hypothetical protein
MGHLLEEDMGPKEAGMDHLEADMEVLIEAEWEML